MKTILYIDGIDGCGKTTTVKQISELLKEEGVRHETLKLPNQEMMDIVAAMNENTPEAIDDYLSHAVPAAICKAAEQLVGDVLVCDRSLLSTMVYQPQHAERTLGHIEKLSEKYKQAYVLLNVHPLVAFKRIQKRNQESAPLDDRYENLPDLQQRANGFHNAMTDLVTHCSKRDIGNIALVRSGRNCHATTREAIKDLLVQLNILGHEAEPEQEPERYDLVESEGYDIDAMTLAIRAYNVTVKLIDAEAQLARTKPGVSRMELLMNAVEIDKRRQELRDEFAGIFDKIDAAKRKAAQEIAEHTEPADESDKPSVTFAKIVDGEPVFTKLDLSDIPDGLRAIIEEFSRP